MTCNVIDDFLVVSKPVSTSAYVNNNLIKNNDVVYRYKESIVGNNILIPFIYNNHYIIFNKTLFDTTQSCKNSQVLVPIDESLYKKNIEKLDYMAQLDNDWDGYGANKFSKKTISNAKIVLSWLKYNQPNIFPTSESGVQFEFYLDRKYLQIVVNNDNVEFFQTDGENLSNDIYEEFDYNISRILKLVNLFFTTRRR